MVMAKHHRECARCYGVTRFQVARTANFIICVFTIKNVAYRTPEWLS